MKGRKRTPTHLHVVKGTDRPGRQNKAEPKPQVGSPRAPDYLSKRGSEIFGRLVARLEGMAMATPTDTEMLALLAARLEEVEDRDAEVRLHGATYAKIELIDVPDSEHPGRTITKAQKVWKAHPATAQRSEAMRHAQSLLAEFALSPASRGRITFEPGGTPTPKSGWEALLDA